MSNEFEKALAEAKGLCLASGIEGQIGPTGTGFAFQPGPDVTVTVESAQSRSDGTFRAHVSVWTRGAKRTTFEAMQFNVLHNRALKLANEIEKRIGTLEFKAAA